MSYSFSIRRIYDDILPVNREALRQVKAIFLAQFSAADPVEIESLGHKMRNPFKERFRPILYVAESMRRHQVLGFAVLLHEPEINFCYLDWIATSSEKSGGGLGGALYECVREETAALKANGLFFECLPDDEKECPDPELLKQNRARLKFYERYDARPIIGTGYEYPVKEGDTCMPHLVFDGMGLHQAPSKQFARKVIRAILERKYGNVCPAEYVEKVVASVTDDPVHLRESRYLKAPVVQTQPGVPIHRHQEIAVVVNTQHAVHHIKERGYVESPVRMEVILAAMDESGFCRRVAVRKFPDRHILEVHDKDFFEYLRRACAHNSGKRPLYPYVFPIRNQARPPKEESVLPGYYCIDTFTPIDKQAFPAAREGADCALTAAYEILGGQRLAYALTRPPGHHAERRAFGGFCYLNNVAIAAQYLSKYGRVAILDIDYHHGNGQQEIFYHRDDLLTISIHGHPSFAYPYFSGFEDENGEGEGVGYNMNIPLAESIAPTTYRKALARALVRIDEFGPEFLVVALGLDPAKGDPTGTWSLKAADFEKNGSMIGELWLPTVVIQEGGYRTRNLGANARAFFQGLAVASYGSSGRKVPKINLLNEIKLRYLPVPEDIERVRSLVTKTGFFYDYEIPIAVELVEERLAKGEASGYNFIFAESYGRVAGYVAYGQIACTASSYDLFWIAVHPDFQGRGVGKLLLTESEKLIAAAGGTRIYIETSHREKYASTRGFYERCGYHLVSLLEDFYGPGDAKATYCRELVPLKKAPSR